MDSSFIYELIGYAASLLVAFSLTMKSLQKLRIVNMIGAVVFIVYGLLIGAIPVAFLNTLILGVNVYNLWQMWQQKDYFTLMQVRADSAYLKKFLEFYRTEISEFVPTYQFKPADDQIVVFILRNMVPVGVVIVKPEGEDARIFLDFVIPGYRDFRAGKFLFEESTEFYRQLGIQRLSTAPGSKRHETYLHRMGFKLEEDGRYYYELPIRIIREHI
ncbi:MAG TPA: YgjV family protein [Anaerolineales bacterium]|nr:YgjV family protein [Anaerolineales bacterium]HNH26264.1 YgjV family protein [Anaerolineales bacterium]